MARILLRDLVPDTVYDFQVRAYGGNSVSEWSRMFTLTTSVDTTPPDVPSWAVTNDWVVDGDTFVATWQPIDYTLPENLDFDHYEISLSDGTTVVTVRTTNISYTLTFDQNRIYFGSPKPTVTARVRSVDKVGNGSAYSAIKSATNPAPANIASVLVQPMYDALQIDWPEVSDIDLIGYRVDVSTTSSTSGYATVYQGPDHSLTFTTYSYLLDHYVRVYAVDKFGTVSSSPITSSAVRPKSGFTLDTTAPANPAGVTATPSFNTTTQESYIDLAWSANTETDLAAYVVRYGQVSGSWSYVTLDKTALGTRLVVIPGASYYVGVAARDYSNNLSGFSSPTPNPVTATADTTAPSTPTAPTIASNTLQAQVTIPGTKAAGGAMETDVSYYEVYASTTTGFTPGTSNMLGTIQNGPAIIGTFDIPASAGTGTAVTWFFVIKAVDRSGNKSAASAQATSSVSLIATANIGDLVVTNAKINDLVANKITAGTGIINDLTVKAKLTLGDASTVGYIESYDYTTSSGTTGFQFSKNGLIIKTGAIEAAALKLQDSNNIMPYAMADFEFDEIYYFISSVPTAKALNWSSATSATFSIDSLQTKFGLRSLKVVQSAAVGRTIYLASSSTVNNIYFPNDGAIYFVSFWVRPTVTNAITGALANGNTSHTSATMKRSIDDATTLTANVWQQVYLQTTAVSIDSGNVRITLPAVAGTWNIDGVMVERKTAGSLKAGAYTPPSTLEISGGMIKTGSIQSNAFSQEWDDATQAFVAGTRPAWSIDKEGDAVFGSLNVFGSLFVGDPADFANSDRYVVMSAFYTAGSSGWIMRGSGEVEFNNITTETLSGQAIKTGTLAVDKISSGTLGAAINITGTGGLTIGAININPVQGFHITTSRTDPITSVVTPGEISFPVDGSDAIFDNVRITAYEATFNGNVKVLGINNYISGNLTLEKNITDPVLPPTVETGWTSTATYLQATGLPSGFGTWGLSDDGGSNYVTTIYNSVNHCELWLINKTTGAMTRFADTTSSIYDAAGYPAVIDSVGGNFTITISSNMYFGQLFRIAARTVTTPGHTDDFYPFTYHPPTSTTYPAQWQVRIYRASTAALTYQWNWDGVLTYPSIYSDGTYVYIGGYYSGSSNNVLNRYNYDGTGGTSIASGSFTVTADGPGGLYVGAADFGATKWLQSTYSNVYVQPVAASQPNDTSLTFPHPEIELGHGCTGIFWDGTQFRSLGLYGKVYKHSTYLGASISRTVSYAWYDSNSTGGLHRSLPSPNASWTTARRGWFKATTSYPPDSGGTDDPDSVSIYIDGILQPPLGSGIITKLYGLFDTSGTGPITGTSEFAALASPGIIESKVTDSTGNLIILKGDGSGRIGPHVWTATEASDFIDTDWAAPTLGGTWVNFGSGHATAGYRRIGKMVYIKGLIKSGTIGTTAFTLPAGFRPAATRMFAQVDGANGIGRLDITAAGAVTPTTGNTNYFSISCSFPVEA